MNNRMNLGLMLVLGSVHKIASGDRFRIQSGNIGMTWTLTVTNVESATSIGFLAPSRENPAPAFPSRGAPAALLPE